MLNVPVLLRRPESLGIEQNYSVHFNCSPLDKFIEVTWVESSLLAPGLLWGQAQHTDLAAGKNRSQLPAEQLRHWQRNTGSPGRRFHGPLWTLCSRSSAETTTERKYSISVLNDLKVNIAKRPFFIRRRVKFPETISVLEKRFFIQLKWNAWKKTPFCQRRFFFVGAMSRA